MAQGDTHAKQFTREEAAEHFKDSVVCGGQSKLSRRGDPRSFFICSQDKGHEPVAHTMCDGQGHVLARWTSETSLIEVWLPDGYHIV